MNNYIFPKLGFSVLVAVFVPFSATEAWDGSDVQEVSYPNEDGGVIRSDAQLLQTSKGLQAPIREDVVDDKSVGYMNSAKKRKTEYKDFPYPPNEDRNFPFAEGG